MFIVHTTASRDDHHAKGGLGEDALNRCLRGLSNQLAAKTCVFDWALIEGGS